MKRLDVFGEAEGEKIIQLLNKCVLCAVCRPAWAGRRWRACCEGRLPPLTLDRLSLPLPRRRSLEERRGALELVALSLKSTGCCEGGRTNRGHGEAGGACMQDAQSQRFHAAGRLGCGAGCAAQVPPHLPPPCHAAAAPSLRPLLPQTWPASSATRAQSSACAPPPCPAAFGVVAWPGRACLPVCLWLYRQGSGDGAGRAMQAAAMHPRYC